MFLYREDYYNAETENKNITDVIVAKHRNGPVDTVQLFFHKEFYKNLQIYFVLKIIFNKTSYINRKII